MFTRILEIKYFVLIKILERQMDKLFLEYKNLGTDTSLMALHTIPDKLFSGYFDDVAVAWSLIFETGSRYKRPYKAWKKAFWILYDASFGSREIIYPSLLKQKDIILKRIADFKEQTERL